MKRRKYNLVVKAGTGLSGGLSGRKVIPGLTTDFLCDWAWTEGTDSISIAHTGSPALGLWPGYFRVRLHSQRGSWAALKIQAQQCEAIAGPGQRQALEERNHGKSAHAGGEMSSIQAMASLLAVSCSPAGWETVVQLQQLQQSRILNYDFLSPNLCCLGAAQQWATSSYTLAIPPSAAMLETIRPGRPPKDAFLREKKKKKKGLKGGGPFVV